jgi:hypothetical protein
MKIKPGWVIVLVFAAGWGWITHGISLAVGRPEVVWPIGIGALMLFLATLWAYAEIVEIAAKAAEADKMREGLAGTGAQKKFSVPR